MNAGKKDTILPVPKASCPISSAKDRGGDRNVSISANSKGKWNFSDRGACDFYYFIIAQRCCRPKYLDFVFTDPPLTRAFAKYGLMTHWAARPEALHHRSHVAT
jgi:hypothetical protein